MKKILFFFVIILLFSCSGQKVVFDEEFDIKTCPNVVFAQNHNIYFTSNQQPVDIENIEFVAEINNYRFSEECFVSNNQLTTELSLLFILTPKKILNEQIVLPYYIATIDSDKNILDLQFYSVSEKLKKINNEYKVKDITDSQRIMIPYKDIAKETNNKIIIGFLLDKEKIEILN